MLVNNIDINVLLVKESTYQEMRRFGRCRHGHFCTMEQPFRISFPWKLVVVNFVL